MNLFKLNPIAIKQTETHTYISLEKYSKQHEEIDVYNATFGGKPAILFKAKDIEIGCIIPVGIMDIYIKEHGYIETMFNLSLSDIAIKDGYIRHLL